MKHRRKRVQPYRFMAPVDEPDLEIDDLVTLGPLEALQDLEQMAELDELAMALQLTIDSLSLLRRGLEAGGGNRATRCAESELPAVWSGGVKR